MSPIFGMLIVPICVTGTFAYGSPGASCGMGSGSVVVVTTRRFAVVGGGVVDGSVGAGAAIVGLSPPFASARFMTIDADAHAVAMTTSALKTSAARRFFTDRVPP